MMKVKAGDIARLGLLFERYHKSLFGFLLRTSGNAALSEDIVQNVFEKMLKNRKQFKGYGKFSTWMYSIARNEWIDHIKKQRRNPELLIMDEERNELTAVSEVSDLDDKNDELRILKKAFSKLDDDQRQLLALTKYENMSYREAGEIMNLSEGNARIKAYRAIKDLRIIYKRLEKQVLS